jgi:hypothetical protein
MEEPTIQTTQLKRWGRFKWEAEAHYEGPPGYTVSVRARTEEQAIDNLKHLILVLGIN